MIVLALIVSSFLENNRTQAPTTPANGTELLGIVILLVNNVSLLEDLLSFLLTDAVLLLDGPALPEIEFQAHLI